MSNLQLFLKGLSNYELASFFKYRYDDFLDGSRKKIISELTNRGLNYQKIDELIEQTTPIQNRKNGKYDFFCPRCKSEKIFISKEKKMRQFRWISYEKSYNKYNCQICNFSFSEPLSTF